MENKLGLSPGPVDRESEDGSFNRRRRTHSNVPLFESEDPDVLFELLEEVATGAYGSIYKGIYIPTDETIAMKIISIEEDGSADNFQTEISVLQRTSHPNIPKYVGSYCKGDEVFIAMEFCDGGALTDIFDVCRQGFTEAEIRYVAHEVLQAVKYLHSQSIIHRDIKCANVLITRQGLVKLVDFGISYISGNRRFAQPSTFTGTPHWMAPEVIETKTGHNPYSAKADIWSFGITLLELSQGFPPLNHMHPMKALLHIPKNDPPALAEPDKWSEEFSSFVSACLQKNPERRLPADQLLQHPFVESPGGQDVVAGLLQRKAECEARRAAQGDEDVDELDDDDEFDQDSYNFNSLKSLHHSLRPFIPDDVESAICTPGTSNPASIPYPASSWSVTNGSPSVSLESYLSKSVTAQPPLGTSQTSNMARPSRDPSGLINTGGGMDVANRPGRAAKAQFRKSTMLRPSASLKQVVKSKAESKRYRARIVNEKLFRKQLNEVRALQTQHRSALDKLKKAHSKEIEQVHSQNISELQSALKEQLQLEGAEERAQKKYVEQQQSNQNAKLARLVRKCSSDMRSKQVETKELVKAQLKEFIAQQRATLQAKLKTLKRRKAKSKAERRVLEDEYARFKLVHQHSLSRAEQRQSHAWWYQRQQQLDILLWTHKAREHALKMENITLRHKLLSSLVDSLHYLRWEHKRRNHVIQRNLPRLKNPVELRHLTQRHELERAQLQQLQELEKEQQRLSLLNDNQVQVKEYRQAMRRLERDLLKKIQDMQKKPGPDVEAEIQHMKQQFVHELIQQDQRLILFLTERERSELDGLALHHQNNFKRMEGAHAAEMEKTVLSHATAYHSLRVKQHTQRLLLLEEHHKTQHNMLKEQYNALLSALSDCHAEKRSLLESIRTGTLEMLEQQYAEMLEELRSHHAAEMAAPSDDRVREELAVAHKEQAEEVESFHKERHSQATAQFERWQADMGAEMEREREELTSTMASETKKLVQEQQAREKKARDLLGQLRHADGERACANCTRRMSEHALAQVTVCTHLDVPISSAELEEEAAELSHQIRSLHDLRNKFVSVDQSIGHQSADDMAGPPTEATVMFATPEASAVLGQDSTFSLTALSPVTSPSRWAADPEDPPGFSSMTSLVSSPEYLASSARRENWNSPKMSDDALRVAAAAAAAAAAATAVRAAAQTTSPWVGAGRGGAACVGTRLAEQHMHEMRFKLFHFSTSTPLPQLWPPVLRQVLW
eukprot:CAMPEP_0177640296 /NCGR_PEP_ID=MMETSP0447-20121125/6469_1 /TAXON_ID=0 /ORGANISM="Stygamoeba regulata, Strain BSH-02190019" /LENGTH=1240 /DNA_ID=CAMNT_0019142361 /DNA_START=237 /DNA_END=3957 /DNA_ORIENTATION=+